MRRFSHLDTDNEISTLTTRSAFHIRDVGCLAVYSCLSPNASNDESTSEPYFHVELGSLNNMMRAILRQPSVIARRCFAVVLLAHVVSCGGDDGSSPVATVPPVVTPAAVASVVVTAPATALELNATMQLAAVVKDASGNVLTGRALQWSSGDATIAVVSTSGLVTGLAVGGPVTITATSEGHSSTTPITVTPPPVATVAVTPAAPPVLLGRTVQLTATLRDARGATLTNRVVAWASSNSAVATVSAQGLVTGVSVGGATVTATSEGKSGTAQLTVVNSVVTGISDPIAFLSRCPTNDPAYNTIRQDFELRGNGQVITVAPTCTEPYTTTQLTDELLAMQTLRMVYYMSQGTAGKLPWTPLALYEWMKSEVGGIDFQSQPGLSACCETFNGKRFIITSRKDVATLSSSYRDWNDVSGWLALFAHEARHADGPGHVTGCPAFPSPTGPLGCDATYDPVNISSYGVQYWLFAAWATGYLNVGIGCLPPVTAQGYALYAQSSANGYLSRFVSNPPPMVTATVPYGGFCFSQ